MRAALFALVVASCGPSSRSNPDGAAGIDSTVVDAAPCNDVVDVVFVLDTSSSMGFVLSQLEQQIAGVVTASNTLAPNAHFGLVVFQDNHKLDATGPMGTVHTTGQTLKAAFANYRTNYTNENRNPGDGPSGPKTQNPIC
ncbi:MAG TPA: hypothetical protein VK427_13445, partial [Kofleriaceae bacterium]|nr:hypothetical protein [Kofleriaceae bacterium]